jgi:hypothetical protein
MEAMGQSYYAFFGESSPTVVSINPDAVEAIANEPAVVMERTWSWMIVQFSVPLCRSHTPMYSR